jgi:hypothetical protein
VHVITLRGTEIVDLTAFIFPPLFERFGLPDVPN